MRRSIRRSEVLYLEARHLLAMHAEALEVGGGAEGGREPGLLESAVDAPRNSYVDTLAELAASYAFGVALNHPFIDGNKRAAVYAMLAFLDVNGIELVLPTEPWTAIFEGVAAGSVTREELAEKLALELVPSRR